MRLVLRFFINRVLGPEKVRKAIIALSAISGIDLLLLAYNNIGVLNYKSDLESGELFLIKDYLKKHFSNAAKPVFFDVGANVGKYSGMLRGEFPGAKIYSFEPNANTFSILTRNLSGKTECFNMGLGSTVKTGQIFTYSDNVASSHASVYKDVFHVFHKAKDVVAIDFQMTTLDRFCEEKSIEKIDFLKIDTEGNELDVLKGAKRMLGDGKIGLIQFEFGECDLFSRVFLKDFYELMPEYDFFRLNSQDLIPLHGYNSMNEIFHFQNIIAVPRKR